MAATVPEDRPRTASIANLILPSAELPERNLLSLSHLAAEMEPVSPADAAAAAAAFARTRSVPSLDRRNQRNNLGVASGNSGKRLSRTKSAFGPGLRRAVAAAAASTVATNTSSSNSSDHRRGGSSFDMQSHSVLRPIHPQASSKATSTTNSLDSHPSKSGAMLTLPRMHPGRLNLDLNKRDIFHQVAAARRNADCIEQPRTPVTPRAMNSNMMDVDMEHREPSCSSHDGRLQTSNMRSAQKVRTTPDAKRAQNRESAKRFRVAQKKRWADLQDLVKEKDEEIQRLTDMLQKVTETRLASNSRPSIGGGTRMDQTAPVSLDAIVMAELDLFVKLVSSSRQLSSSTHVSSRRNAPVLTSPASNIGSLHRVLVASIDGCITGVRHQNRCAGIVAGGRVGQYVWDDVPESDNLQLRFTVLHASSMAANMAREALVFAYRRRVQKCKEEQKVDGNTERQEDVRQDEEFARMKGCVHPVLGERGEISHLLLAEFVET